WSGCAGRRAARWRSGSRAAGRRCRGSASGAGAGSRFAPLGIAEAVAQAAHRLDDAVSELAAQMVDMHVQGVAFHLLADAVEGVLQLLATEDASGIAQQCLEQRMLAAGQFHRAAIKQSDPG